MEYNLVLISTITMAGIAFLLSAGLTIANKKLKVKSDPRIDKIMNFLPNANCAGCGFASCHTYATALVNTGASLDRCKAMDTENLKRISDILGIDFSPMEKETAIIYCAGAENCMDKYNYSGIETCQASSKIFQGQKSCIYGCLTFGDCARACPFDAIIFTPGKVPVINKEKCTGCGLCVNICPKKIISLRANKYDVHIKCSSLDRGSEVRNICKSGCIACGICVKVCPTKAIQIKDNLARIDYKKCTVCGLCVEKCPTNTIERILPEIKV